MKNCKLLLVSAIAALGWCNSVADAHPRVGIGISFGVPYCSPWGYYPYYGYGYGYGYGYAPAYPVYVSPAPVIYQAAPVVVQPAPVVVRSAQPEPVTSYSPPPITTVASSGESNKGQGAFDQHMQMLRSKEENVRRDAAMDLGRMKADRAVDPLTATLAGDSSPAVRDAAARALGLIGSPRSLTALIRAAQADNDRDVRHSAQFAVEIIRTNLKN